MSDTPIEDSIKALHYARTRTKEPPRGDGYDEAYIAFGNVHLTIEAAQEHADALRRINTQGGYMLTDAEIDSVPFTGYMPAHSRGHSENDALRIFARAVITAYEAKLRAGTEPPEPDTHCWDTDSEQDCWSHSKDQILAYGDTRDRAGYSRGLEEGNTKCETLRTALSLAKSVIQNAIPTEQWDSHEVAVINAALMESK